MTLPPTTTQIYERRLQNLRQRFIDGLPFRILVLEQHAIELRADGKNRKALAAIKHECHKLAGVAASFGCPDIGARAGEIDTGISLGTMTRDEVTEALEDLMNQMEDLLDDTPNDS